MKLNYNFGLFLPKFGIFHINSMPLTCHPTPVVAEVLTDVKVQLSRSSRRAEKQTFTSKLPALPIIYLHESHEKIRCPPRVIGRRYPSRIRFCEVANGN